MTEQQMIEWIDTASYRDLLYHWRFAKSGAPMLSGVVGDHFALTLKKRREEVGPEEHTRVSKAIGWGS